ncbi:MAG: PTS system mannose/fructose/sorbose family transporter subunit IID [candidate division WOR-3 bacterium]
MGAINFLKGLFALLLLQSSWCYQKKQTLGFLYALSMFLHYQHENFFQKAKIIYESAFNTNPYCSSVILGIMLNNSKIPANSLIGLQHLYGSLGDEFFWRTLRPILLMLATILPFYGYLKTNGIYLSNIYYLSPFVFLIPFLIISQGTRYYWFLKAYWTGNKATISLANFLRKPLPILYHLRTFISGWLVVLILLIILFGFSQNIVSFKSIVSFLFVIIIVLLLLLRFANRYEMSSYLLIIGLLIFLLIKVL